MTHVQDRTYLACGNLRGDCLDLIVRFTIRCSFIGTCNRRSVLNHFRIIWKNLNNSYSKLKKRRKCCSPQIAFTHSPFSSCVFSLALLILFLLKVPFQQFYILPGAGQNYRGSSGDRVLWAKTSHFRNGWATKYKEGKFTANQLTTRAALVTNWDFGSTVTCKQLSAFLSG